MRKGMLLLWMNVWKACFQGTKAILEYTRRRLGGGSEELTLYAIGLPKRPLCIRVGWLDLLRP